MFSMPMPVPSQHKTKKKCISEYIKTTGKNLEKFWPHICASGFHLFFINVAFFISRYDLLVVSTIMFILSLAIFTDVQVRANSGKGVFHAIYNTASRKKFAIIIESLFLPPLTILYGGIIFLLMEHKHVVIKGSMLPFTNDLIAFVISVCTATLCYTILYVYEDIMPTKTMKKDIRFTSAAIAGACTFGTISLFIHTNTMFQIAALGLAGISLAGQIFRFWIPISGHTLTIMYLYVSLTLVNHWFGVMIILPLLVAWSRLKLHRHTIPQIVLGGCLGACIPLACLEFLKFLGIVTTLGFP